jgi:hypothetical protein
MVRNPWDVKVNFGPHSKRKGKRTLGIRDKQILYHRAKKKCEACGRKIDFSEMHAGHKNAASKGGGATLRNSVCICARCNKLQGADSWATFMNKMGRSNIRSVTSAKRRKPSKKRTTRRRRKRKPQADFWGLPKVPKSRRIF